MVKIGNFRIKEDGNNFSVGYHRGAKDWLDIIVIMVMSLVGLAGTFISIASLLDKFSIIVLLAGAAFAFFTFLKLADGMVRLFKNTHSMLKINTDTHILSLKRFFGNTKEFHFSDIARIKMTSHSETVGTGNDMQIREYYTIEAITKSNETVLLFAINPTQILDLSRSKVELDLITTSRHLTKFLSEKVGVTYSG